MDGAAKKDAAGLSAFATCDFEAAEATYAGLVAEHRLNLYYHLNLGAARDKLGQTDLAVAWYMKAIELGEAAPIATLVESDGCDTAAAASSVDETVSTTVANLGRENLARLLKAN
jgi:Flp pilus assembly protein TadD